MICSDGCFCGGCDCVIFFCDVGSDKGWWFWVIEVNCVWDWSLCCLDKINWMFSLIEINWDKVSNVVVVFVGIGKIGCRDRCVDFWIYRCGVGDIWFGWNWYY